MAESTALAEGHTDTERHDNQRAASRGPAAVAKAAGTAGAASASTTVTTVPAEPLVAAELLVEEVSIDGMCGVY